MKKRIKLLGHTIEKGIISAAKERLERILNWKIPKNRKQLQSFIGLLNYVAPHFPHAATVAAPLTELTGSNVTSHWDDMHTLAFNQHKQLCDDAASLTPLNKQDDKRGNTNVFIVTDASKVGT